MADEKRLIDANKLMDLFRRYMAENCDRERCISEDACKTCERECIWRRVVRDAPTVDAVEVVRCKDCKHWSMGYCNYFAYYSYEPMTNEDDFCSYGERRTDG